MTSVERIVLSFKFLASSACVLVSRAWLSGRSRLHLFSAARTSALAEPSITPRLVGCVLMTWEPRAWQCSPSVFICERFSRKIGVPENPLHAKDGHLLAALPELGY